MKTRIDIHPDYEHLRGWIEELPDADTAQYKMIRDQRNTIFRATVDRKAYVVKRFKRPNPFNRVVYTFFRPSKAQRAYENALWLLENSIGTAAPVAWIEIKKGGLFHTGYFVAEYLPHPQLKSVEDHHDRDRILDDFARFTARLHRLGVIHGDYNVENIYFYERNDEYRFAVIDNNRIRFRAPSQHRCAGDLKRIGLPMELLVRVTERYARLRGWNPEVFCGRVLLKRGLNLKKRFKAQLRQITHFRKEDIFPHRRQPVLFREGK